MNALRVALGINSGNSIFIVAFVALCGARQTHFSREGLGTNSLSQSLSVKPQGCLPGSTPSVLPLRGNPPSPRGRLFAVAGKFLIAPNTLVTNVTAWLSLRGKTSPAPGEDVTAGDKRGNLARERLRGFSLLKVGRSSLRSAALSQKAALQMPFPSTTPPVKMGYRNARRRSDIPKFKIILPLVMPRAQRRAF